MTHLRRFVMWLSFLAILFGEAACRSATNSDPLALDIGRRGHSWWDRERADRQSRLDLYLAENREALSLFANYANGKAGVPLVLFRVFPEIFPDIWRKDRVDYNLPGLKMSAAGIRALPLGLGWASDYEFHGKAPEYQIVNVTCGACHMGFALNQEGEEIRLPGGSNQKFSFFGYLLTLRRTVQDPRFNFQNFKQALEKHSKNPDFFFRSDRISDVGKASLLRDQAQRDVALFINGGQKLFAEVKANLLKRSQVVTFMEQKMYQTEGTKGTRPHLSELIGSFDAYGVAHAGIAAKALKNGTNPQSLKLRPSRTDIPSVWLQRDRPNAQWDGTIANPLLRNLAAAGASVMDSTLLDVDLAEQSRILLRDLPPAPYPYDIDEERVMRGRKLAAQYCEGCHQAGSGQVYSPTVVGTSPNRAELYTPEFSAALSKTLIAGCTDTVLCKTVTTDKGPMVQRDDSKVGYTAIPLAGIWATAPYLHNGSIPTIAHLLIPRSRPKTFYRGSLVYDQIRMGFSWENPERDTVLYDTSLEGQSNSGHETAEFNGPVDWEKNPDQLEDLISYLKSL